MIVEMHPEYNTVKEAAWKAKQGVEYYLAVVAFGFLAMLIVHANGLCALVTALFLPLVWAVIGFTLVFDPKTLRWSDFLFWKAPNKSYFRHLENRIATVGKEILNLDREKVLRLTFDETHHVSDEVLSGLAREILTLEHQFNDLCPAEPLKSICAAGIQTKRDALSATYHCLLAEGMVFKWDNHKRHYFQIAEH